MLYYVNIQDIMKLLNVKLKVLWLNCLKKQKQTL